MVLVRFINHACFSIERKDSLTLMDPWFCGRIFNNSWSLIRETNIDSIKGIHKLKNIVISHEHPDHLHFQTLKKLRKYSENDITLYMPYRSNDNVKKEVEKIGFKFEYLRPKSPLIIEDDFFLCAFPTGHDAAIVFDIEGKVLLNQNDAYLTESQCYEVSSFYPSIDSWWMQFSLAGYYANKSEPDEIIDRGHMFHLKEFDKYQKFFKPKISVPFASFCYFCKYFNSYLNNYVVTPKILDGYCSLPINVLGYGEQMGWDCSDNNGHSISIWEDIYDSERTIDSHPNKIDIQELISNGDKLFTSSNYNYKNAPSALFELYDYEDHLVAIDFSNKRVELKERATCNPAYIAGITSSEELNSYLKFPWGADTLNITGAFEIRNEILWKNMLIFRDMLYVR